MLPDWFISNDYLRPVLCDFGHGLQLACDDFECLVRFSLLYTNQHANTPILGRGNHTSRVSPIHSMTPRPFLRAACVLLATN